MLSKVLSKSTCANCRFCCSFRRSSLWETPLFDIKTVDKFNGVDFIINQKDNMKYGLMNLSDKYISDNEDEEVACEFLDSKKGCLLSDEDKPFDCKIWPLRIMNRNGRLVIALTPTCPAINNIEGSKECGKTAEACEQATESEGSDSVMKGLVDSGLGDVIYNYAKEHPYIIKEYIDGFPVLKEF